MKKLLLLCPFICMLTGCAMGINHNIAQINGKPYLVETKNYGFWVTQWSEKSTLIPLDSLQENLFSVKTDARAELAKIAAQCNVQAANSRSRTNYKKLYKCVVDKLTEME